MALGEPVQAREVRVQWRPRVIGVVAHLDVARDAQHQCPVIGHRQLERARVDGGCRLEVVGPLREDIGPRRAGAERVLAWRRSARIVASEGHRAERDHDEDWDVQAVGARMHIVIDVGADGV